MAEQATKNPGAPVDHAGLEVLDLERCLELLGSVPVGRVAYQARGDVIVLPVNHVRDGRTVAFRTSVGSKLDAAQRATQVTFEVDDYDEASRSGWSVLVVGRAEVVDDQAERRRLDRLGAHPWSDGDARPYWVRIRPDEISGRRITA